MSWNDDGLLKSIQVHGIISVGTQDHCHHAPDPFITVEFGGCKGDRVMVYLTPKVAHDLSLQLSKMNLTLENPPM